MKQDPRAKYRGEPLVNNIALDLVSWGIEDRTAKAKKDCEDRRRRKSKTGEKP